jgi:hypothetical protein
MLQRTRTVLGKFVETMWLEDFLPKDEVFQYARIMLLNHQTRWDVSASSKRFEQHAESMLQEIEYAREASHTSAGICTSVDCLLTISIYRKTQPVQSSL